MDTLLKDEMGTSIQAEILGKISSRIGPRQTREIWKLLLPEERADIFQYYLAKRIWEANPTANINDVANKVGREYHNVFRWLKGLRRPKAVHIIETLRVHEGVLISWPPLREAFEELYMGRRMSTTKIAKIFRVNRVTVFQRLRRFGIPLRERVEAYMEAVTKYQKKSFSGNMLEAAYMIGLRLSDYDASWAKREGGTVLVRTGTTHPSMIQLAHDVFGSYGGVVNRARINSHGEYHWVVDCYLDSSFGFLVKKPHGIPETILRNPETFLHCLAGLIDGDGWVGLDNCWVSRLRQK